MSRSSAFTTFNTLTDPKCQSRQTDFIASPPGELLGETNDNSMTTFLTYGTTRDLLAGDAEAKEEG